MFRVGVLQELLVAGLTPPPGPHPAVTEDKEASNDMNTKEDGGGSPFPPWILIGGLWLHRPLSQTPCHPEPRYLWGK